MIIICLLIGWCFIIIYNKIKGFSLGQLLSMSWHGIREASNVLLMLATVGMLTGSWRASGTIAYIVRLSMGLIRPQILLICVFWLNCLVSFLIGTSFGTVATMGVISIIVANASGLPLILSAGAVMSGIYFGDRCSPISSSAMLVADITDTDILANIKNMFRYAAIPFAMTSLLYLVIGSFVSKGQGVLSMDQVFNQEFRLSPLVLLPVIIVFSMVLARCNVKLSMLAGCLTAALLCVFFQGYELLEIGRILILGFKATDPVVAGMMDGGGLWSMARVLGIVCLSSTYAGLIRGTGFANPIKEKIIRFSGRVGRYQAVCLVSILSSMLGCNQTLAIMLTREFCGELYQDKERLALDLENSVVMIAPLVPWCIAGAVPVATLGASPLCLFTSFYLFLIPLWGLIWKGR